MRPFFRARRAAIALITGASTTPSGMKGSSSSSRATMSWSFSPICQAGRMCKWRLRSASLNSLSGMLWLLTGNCAGIKKKAGLDVTNYDSIMRFVKAGDPDKSKLHKSLLGKGAKLMPPKNPLSDDQIAVIDAWIAAGAKKD